MPVQDLQDSKFRDNLQENSWSDLHMRAICCERSVLAQADGSARWSQGRTSVIASVYGPRQGRSRWEDPEQAKIEISVVSALDSGGVRQQRLEQVLRQIVEATLLTNLYPRTLVSIIIQVLSRDGSLVSCALNAVSAALTDAGAQMRHTIVASTCSLMDSERYIIDPDKDEEEVATATITSCFSARAEPGIGVSVLVGPLAIIAHGNQSVRQYNKLLALSCSCCKKIAAFSRVSLRSSLLKE